MTLSDPVTPDPDLPELELIGVLTGPPWSAVPHPLYLVPCGARAALFAPAPPVATARDAVRAALHRMHAYEQSGLIGRLLPVAPGARIAPPQAPAVLARADAALARAEEEVRGSVEYQLRVSWAEDRVLSAFRDSPELAPVLAAPRVRAGDLAQAVARLVRRLAATMDDEIARAGFATADQPRGPGMILHRALLVPPIAPAALDSCLERIDALWSDGLSLRLVGPMPPVSFVLFEAVRVDPARLTAARRLLGSVGSLGPKAVAAARRAALRTATDTNAADAIRSAATDLMLETEGAETAQWRLERRIGGVAQPASIVA